MLKTINPHAQLIKNIDLALNHGLFALDEYEDDPVKLTKALNMSLRASKKYLSELDNLENL